MQHADVSSIIDLLEGHFDLFLIVWVFQCGQRTFRGKKGANTKHLYLFTVSGPKFTSTLFSLLQAVCLIAEDCFKM